MHFFGQFPVQRKTPTQVTCAYCQRSITCDPFLEPPRRPFVPGEPPILHRPLSPSTPSARYFCLRCCGRRTLPAAGWRILRSTPPFGKPFSKVFFTFRVRRCSFAKLISGDPSRRRCVVAMHLSMSQKYSCEVALTDLQNTLETRSKHALRIFDDFRIDAHSSLLELSVGFGVARRKTRGGQ